MVSSLTIPIPNSDIWLDAKIIAELFTQAGYVIYAVGGSVRDMLLNRPIHDIDFATSADPETVELLAIKAGWKTIAVGKSFGVIIILLPNSRSFEIATFRTDGEYINGRHPEGIRFADEKSDVQRRDITINALLLNIFTGVITDYVNGLSDLDNKIIRIVGQADQRLQEDRLRIIRVLRFAGHLGFTIDPQTWNAICTIPLSGLAQERIVQEWIKSCALNGRAEWYRLSSTSGCLQQWCPIVKERSNLQHQIVVDALTRLPINDRVENGLSSLGEIAQTLMLIDLPVSLRNSWLTNLPLAKTMCQTIQWLLRMIETRDQWIAAPADVRFRELQRGSVHQLVIALQAWCPAWSGQTSLATWQHDLRAQPTWKSELMAKDLIRLGWQPGPLLGQILHQVANAELRGEIQDHDQAVAFVEKIRNN